MKLALKIDVNTYLGTRHGVPRLIDMLQAHGADATFLFSLGRDHTGRAVKRIFRRGFFGRMKRTSVLRHYGLRTVLYGTLLPGPDIGRECAATMRSVRDAGFEVGIHALNHVLWQDQVAAQGAEWTHGQMTLACKRFQEIFGEPAHVHGAAGWQMNRHAFRLTQHLAFHYCSDTRGSGPFIPVWQAEIMACPQIPTTLPTLDELIGTDGITENNVAAHLLELTRDPPATGHVYTLHAELEGRRLAPVFDALLQGWRAQGYDLVSLRKYAESLDGYDLPRHSVSTGPVPGRAGVVATQGLEFLRPQPKA